ncbi:hypothetical protein TNIN_28301, partial [Trichonephila inaurata madagascariensis]
SNVEFDMIVQGPSSNES